MTIAEQVTQAADRAIALTALFQNPYFIALENGTMSKEAFIASQEQFFFAVAYFSRPMTYLIARIPDPKRRLDILHNIVEEHGDFHEKAFHETTFKMLLERLGSKREMQPQAGVMAFNTALTGIAITEQPEMAIAAIGIIEYAFADISARIGVAIVKNGWLQQEQLIHYNLHADLDKQHSQEFFELVEADMGREDTRAVVERGLMLGAHLFNQLYISI